MEFDVYGFETKTDSKGRVWHRHGMPDAGTDSHSEARLASIYGTKSGNAWHWTSDAHSVDGVAHGDKVTRFTAPRSGKAIQSLTTGALDESVIQHAQAIELAFEAAGFSKN